MAKILIVEDEAIIALGLRLELENSGHVIADCVSTGADAIAAAEKHRPELVIMDVHLAGNMDGLAAAETIQARWKTPMILMTGYTDQEITLAASAPGGKRRSVSKPVNIKQLQALICELTA